MEPRPEKKVGEFDSEEAVPFNVFKKSLGAAASKYTDEEIECMRGVCDRIANAVFETWLKERNAHSILESQNTL